MVAGGTPARRACSRMESSATSSGRSSIQRAAVFNCDGRPSNASTIEALRGPLPSIRPSIRIVSTQRQGIHQAALGPQTIEATRQLERAACADIALIALAVVPDLLDDVVGPLLV